MTRAEKLRERAHRKLIGLQRRSRDQRYLRTLGRFVDAGWLVTNQVVLRHHEPLRVADVLWAGEAEPPNWADDRSVTTMFAHAMPKMTANVKQALRFLRSRGRVTPPKDGEMTFFSTRISA